MSKPKISVVYHSTVFKSKDGIFLKKHWGQYFNELSKSFDLNIICFPSNKREFFHDFKVNNDEINFHLTNEKNPLTKVFSRIKVFSYLFPRSKIIFILMPSITSVLAGLFCMLLNRKYGLYFGLEPFNNRYNWFIKLILKWLINKAKFCLGTGSQVVEEIKKYSKVVYHTKPNILFNTKDICTKTNFNTPVNLLFIGSLEKRKGLEYLIQALKKPILQSKINKLRIVGDGILMGELKKLTVDIGLENKVDFVGYVSDSKDLIKYYKTSDIFILPSFEEGFPRVLYESMINGLVIITTPVNSIPSLLKNNESAIFIDPGSSDSIENALNNLILNPDLMPRLALNSQKIIRSIIDKSASDQHSEIIFNHI